MRRRELLGALPAAIGGGALARLAHAAPALAPERLRASDPERYWAQVRRDQFLLADDYAYLHTGTLGVPAVPALQAVAAGLIRSGTVGLGPINRWGAPIEEINARTFVELRAALASAFGCKPSELTLTHNTTDGLGMLARGLPLKPGDEVLITSLEHFANVDCWTRAARERGIVVKRVALTLKAQTADEIVAAFAAAIGPATRVVSVAAIVTGTGARLPVERIVALAKARGVITIVDGAHLPGQAPLDLTELGCDYLAASPHKWLFAPAGCGFLYGRGHGLASLAQRLMPCDAGCNPAGQLMQVGTNSGAIFDGFAAALAFYQALTPAAIFARLGALRDHMLREARSLPGVELYTSDDPAASAGMVAFRIAGVELRKLAPAFAAANIRVAPGTGIRLSAHIHTRPADIDCFFAVLRRALANA